MRQLLIPLTIPAPTDHAKYNVKPSHLLHSKETKRKIDAKSEKQTHPHKTNLFHLLYEKRRKIWLSPPKRVLTSLTILPLCSPNVSSNHVEPNFSHFPHRLRVRENRNSRWLLAPDAFLVGCFGQSKVPRRQAKSGDHLTTGENAKRAS